MLPLSHTPVSLVDVCADGPSLNQLMVEPTVMVIVCGLKEKFCVKTCRVVGGQAGVAVIVGVRVGVGVMVAVGQFVPRYE